MKKIYNSFLRFILKSLPLIYFPRINIFIFNLLGFNIHKSCRIYSSVQIFGDIKVNISNNTFIGNESVITGGASGNITIGNNCDISDRVSIFCGTHEIATNKYNLIKIAGKGISKNITIGNGVWIGYGSLILPGVNIGNFSIIAAGTVVNKSVPEYCLAAGNPMKIIRKIF